MGLQNDTHGAILHRFLIFASGISRNTRRLSFGLPSSRDRVRGLSTLRMKNSVASVGGTLLTDNRDVSTGRPMLDVTISDLLIKYFTLHDELFILFPRNPSCRVDQTGDGRP